MHGDRWAPPMPPRPLGTTSPIPSQRRWGIGQVLMIAGNRIWGWGQGHGLDCEVVWRSSTAIPGGRAETKGTGQGHEAWDSVASGAVPVGRPMAAFCLPGARLWVSPGRCWADKHLHGSFFLSLWDLENYLLPLVPGAPAPSSNLGSIIHSSLQVGCGVSSQML